MNIIRDLKYFAKIPVDIDGDNYLQYGMLFFTKNVDIAVEFLENKKILIMPLICISPLILHL